jgi:hypothetical protein
MVRLQPAGTGVLSNVWWSMANEWDLVNSKTPADWNRFGNFLAQEDPYHHLRSIHQCVRIFDSASA